MIWYAPWPPAKSSATFCTSAESSSWVILMSIPVSFLKGARFAAIAEVGAVFSEMKLSVVPANCFQSSPATGLAALNDPPQPPSHSAAPPAPAILSTSRREYVTRLLLSDGGLPERMHAGTPLWLHFLKWPVRSSRIAPAGAATAT